MFQRFLAFLEKTISKALSLQSSRTINEEKNESIHEYFFDFGSRIGIVGTNGKIHTVTGYWSIRHYYYYDNKDGEILLLQRVPIRKDLKEGERLATRKELLDWVTQKFSNRCFMDEMNQFFS